MMHGQDTQDTHGDEAKHKADLKESSLDFHWTWLKTRIKLDTN